MNIEYNDLLNIYMLACRYYKEHNGAITNEEGRAIVNCHNVLKNYQATREKEAKKSKQQQTHTSTFHYVSLYKPLLKEYNLEDIVRVGYDNYDSVDGVETKKGTRTVAGFWNNREETYYYRVPFPIIVEKNGNVIIDVITKEQYILIPREDKSVQVRYKGKYYYVNEKYLTNELVVNVESSLSAMEVADMLRRLTPQDAQIYKEKIDRTRNTIASVNRDYFRVKREYYQNNLSDEEYIRRFGRR